MRPLSKAALCILAAISHVDLTVAFHHLQDRLHLSSSLRVHASTSTPTSTTSSLDVESAKDGPTSIANYSNINAVDPDNTYLENSGRTNHKKSVASGNFVTIATSIEQLLSIMNDESSDKLTLILYHANYCKICQRAGIQLKKAAKEYPSVHFAKVESSVFPDPAADSLR